MHKRLKQSTSRHCPAPKALPLVVIWSTHRAQDGDHYLRSKGLHRSPGARAVGRLQYATHMTVLAELPPP
jgi:hypothetical protein